MISTHFLHQLMIAGVLIYQLSACGLSTSSKPEVQPTVIGKVTDSMSAQPVEGASLMLCVNVEAGELMPGGATVDIELWPLE